MKEKNLASETVKERKLNSGKSQIAAIYFRWFLAVFTILQYFVVFENHDHILAFLGLLLFTIAYNSTLTFYMLKSSDSFRKFSILFIYSDIILLSLFTILLGGTGSDIYLLYLFIIGYCGLNAKNTNALKVSIFGVVLYTSACVISAIYSIGELSLVRLIIRDIFILICTYGVSVISFEVKKYDELHKREFRLARTDKLTGLANRHYFDQKILDEVEYANATGKPLNILMFDLDNFKKFNDTYGHVRGDKLLTLFSDIIRQNIRRGDIPVRLGGEEFLILIRELDIETAKSVSERIRRQLEKQHIYIGDDERKIKATVSSGVAQYPKHGTDIKAVLDFADQALYRAKESGRNMVVTYDELLNDLEQAE